MMKLSACTSSHSNKWRKRKQFVTKIQGKPLIIHSMCYNSKHENVTYHLSTGECASSYSSKQRKKHAGHMHADNTSHVEMPKI